MAFSSHVVLAPSPTSAAGQYPQATGMSMNVEAGGIAVNLIVDAVGGSPSMTFQVEGSVDGGTNWFVVPALVEGATSITSGRTVTVTSVSSIMIFLAEPYPHIRLNVTALNNVTFHANAYAVQQDMPTVQRVAGGVLTGVADDGSSPVKIGGVVNGNAQSFSNGQRAALHLSQGGELYVRLRNGNGTDVNSGSPGDGVANGNNGLYEVAFNELWNGSTWDRQRTPFVFKSIASTAIGSEATIWTPTAGKKFRLMGFVLSTSAAVDVTLKDNTAGTTIFRIPTLVSGSPLHVLLGNGILSAAANNVLTATSSGAANLIGTLIGTEE